MNTIITSYITDCMKERYEILSSRILPCKKDLKNITVNNGFLLPVIKTDARYMMGRGGVLDQEKRFIPLSGIYSGGNRITILDDKVANPETYMGEGYDFDSSLVTDVIRDEAVYLGFIHNHWGHFLIDFSTRLWFVKEISDKAKLVFIVKKGQEFSLIPNIKRFLELYGIDHNRIIFVNKITKFDKLIIPEPSYQSNTYYSEAYLRMFECVANNAKYSSTYKNVYFSRGVFKKALTTEFGGDLIDSVFEKAGFVKIYPEKSSLDEQIGLIRGADIIAGVSGTVTHNMLFAREGQKINIINKTYIMNTMQSDINIMKQLDATYVDAYSAYYPVSLGIGPFLFERTEQLAAFLKAEYNVDINYVHESTNNSKDAFKQYMKAYERLAVNNYLKPFFDENEDSAHFYPWKLMGEAVKLHYQELHGKLRRRNILRKLLGR